MIGIVTPYNVHNYGSKLQAYAVQTLLNDNNIENEIIVYESIAEKRIVKRLLKVISPLSWYSLALRRKAQKQIGLSTEQSELMAKNIKQRNEAIDSFDSRYSLSEKSIGYDNLTKYAKRYESVVVGSDQVWNPMNLPGKFTTLQFLDAKTDKISLSASFGVEKITPCFLKYYYKKFLRNINIITVRERQGVNICHELLPGIQVYELPDPTLLLEPTYWHALANCTEVNIKEKYCFCYFLGDNPEHRIIAREFAQKEGFKIVSLIHFKKYNKADENFADYELYDISPEKFLALICNAAFVLTDSFHGTVFSMVFHRQFFVVERYRINDSESANSRITNLLSKVNLMNRLINKASAFTGASQIEYELVDKMLMAYRSKSMCSLNYIFDHLHEVNV